VEHFLVREGQGVENYLQELGRHSPFKQNQRLDR